MPRARQRDHSATGLLRPGAPRLAATFAQPHEFQSMPADPEPARRGCASLQLLGQRGAQTHVFHPIASNTAHMVVWLDIAIKSSTRAAHGHRRNHAGPAKDLQVPVHRGQADAPHVVTDARVKLVGRRVRRQLSQLGQDRPPLASHADKRLGLSWVDARHINNDSYYHFQQPASRTWPSLACHTARQKPAPGRPSVHLVTPAGAAAGKARADAEHPGHGRGTVRTAKARPAQPSWRPRQGVAIRPFRDTLYGTSVLATCSGVAEPCWCGHFADTYQQPPNRLCTGDK